MLHNLAGSLANFFVKQGVVDPEDYEVCEFGWETILATAASLGTILFLSIVLGELIGTVAFLVVFIFLRSYIGGYHATTHLNCYLSFVTVYLLAFGIQKLFPPQYLLIALILLSIFCITFVFRLAPKEHPNRPISPTERVKFTRIGRFFAIFFSVVNLLIYLQFSTVNLSLWIVLSLTSATVLLLIPCKKIETD